MADEVMSMILVASASAGDGCFALMVEAEEARDSFRFVSWALTGASICWGDDDGGFLPDLVAFSLWCQADTEAGPTCKRVKSRWIWWSLLTGAR